MKEDLLPRPPLCVMTLDDHAFQAKDEKALVRKLRADSFSSSKNYHDFMAQFAERSRLLWRDITIRTDTAENFVADLLKFGILKRVDPKTVRQINLRSKGRRIHLHGFLPKPPTEREESANGHVS